MHAPPDSSECVMSFANLCVVQAGNFIRSFEDVSAAVDAALDSDTRTPWNKLFQK